MSRAQFNNQLLSLENNLKYYALSLTSDKERANDLLQETFLKALTYQDKFSENTNFKAWVYTIMKNTFINDYRKASKSKNSLSGSNSEFHLLIAKDRIYPSPESFYSTNEIEKSISELDDEYRIPFQMFLDGYKYKEIAERLELPLGTVKSRIFFTRKKLTATLKDFVQ
ncbi:MAG TPA: sigma-70 family RNA polymerase sigma factor [Prolixibacteraceae bacterium]|nr:sigma-70 family RNA polymerase sigma factor [Prolixibacteraceae bacterium]